MLTVSLGGRLTLCFMIFIYWFICLFSHQIHHKSPNLLAVFSNTPNELFMTSAEFSEI